MSQWKQHGCLPSCPQCWCEVASERGRKSCGWSLCWLETAVSPRSKDSKLSSPIPRKKELETKRNCRIRLGRRLGKQRRERYGTKVVKSKSHPQRSLGVFFWILSISLSATFMIFKVRFSYCRPIHPMDSLVGTLGINASGGRWHCPTTSYLQHLCGSSNIELFPWWCSAFPFGRNNVNMDLILYSRT